MLTLGVGTWAAETFPDEHGSKHVLGKYLAMLRDRRHLTQREVAAGAGISGGYLSQIENATRLGVPSRDALVGLARFFAIPESDLFRAAGLDEPNSDAELSTSDAFRRIVTFEPFRCFDEGEIRWISPEIQRRWVDFAKRLDESVRLYALGVQEAMSYTSGDVDVASMDPRIIVANDVRRFLANASEDEVVLVNSLLSHMRNRRSKDAPEDR